jgi:hypothetical protein
MINNVCGGYVDEGGGDCYSISNQQMQSNIYAAERFLQ